MLYGAHEVSTMKPDLLERTAAGLALILVFPVLVVCALAVFLEDRGPILFRQRRIGRHGRPFLLLKLRSMKTKSMGRSITAGNDTRITAVGKRLREYKIDELPQLWNVFRGDMSLVGPRPEVPEYVDLSDPRWQTVLSVNAGITDLASLVFRHEARLLAEQKDAEKFYRDWLLPRKLDLSAHYIRTRSMTSDARLIALTVRQMFVREQLDGKDMAQQFGYQGALHE
jgi:lipopolysaccharide/colanic/teichoic acid biosynthesis glycosyltransferase